MELDEQTKRALFRFQIIAPLISGNLCKQEMARVRREILNTRGVWSIARGLARRGNDYKQHLMNCDQGRLNDLDGRGNLSEEALAQFTRFFLLTCIDQVDFMEGLVQPERLRSRILSWAEAESKTDRLLPNAPRVLEAVLYRGELPRGDVPRSIGLGERQAEEWSRD